MRKSGLSARWAAVLDTFGFGSREKRRTAKPPKGRSLQLEPLESRQLLAVVAPMQPAPPTLYWDPDGVSDSHYGGSGNWTDTNAWVDWSGARYTWDGSRTGDSAVFQGDSGIVSLDVSIKAAALTFDTADYTLTGSDLTLTGNGPTISADQSGTINSDLVLGSSQTWTTASSTTLAVGGKVNLGSYQLTVSGSGTTDISGMVLGSGKLAESGTSTLVLSGANTYTGTTTVGAGTTLQIGNDTANGAGSGTMTVNGTLNLNGHSIAVGRIGGSGTITSSVAGAAIRIGNNNLGGTFFGLIEDGSGTVALAKVGTGTLILTGNNTYSGGTTISGGELRVGSVTSTGTLGTGTVVDNAVLAFNRTGTATIANAISGTGTLEQRRGTIILTGNNSYLGTTTVLSNSVLQVGNGGTTGTLGLGAVTDNGILAFNRSDSITVGNMISGSGSLSQQGTNKLILNGSNAYTGNTTINAGGTLQLGGSSAVGSGAGLMNVNGTLDLKGYSLSVGSLTGRGVVTSNGSGTSILTVGINGQNTTFSGVIGNGSGVVAVKKVGAGTLAVTGLNTYTGGTTVNAGILRVGNHSVTSLGTGQVTVDAGATIKIVTANPNALPNGVGSGNVVINGTLDLNSYNLTVGNLTGSGLVTSSWTGACTLSVGNSNSGGTFSGIIQDALGTVALTKVGTGTLILTGNNTHSGGTTISGGSLRVGSATSTGSLGTGAVVNDALLVFNRAGTTTVANAISGTGTIEQWRSVVILAANNSYLGTTSISSGATLQIGDGGTTGTLGSGSVTDKGTLVFKRSDSITIGNTISGSGGLSQQGTGELTLTGVNGYTGNTTINTGGTLKLGGSSAIGAGTGLVTVNGTLNMNGSSVIMGGLAGTGMVTTGVAGLVTLTVGNMNVSSTFYGGAIEDGSGQLELVKVGAGTLALAGVNTYTGSTTVVGGTLRVGNHSSATLGSGQLTVNVGATLKIVTNNANALPNGVGAANVIIDGTLDLNSYSVTVGGLAGSGVVTSSYGTGMAYVLNVGNNNLDSTFSGVIENGLGALTLAKAGVGTLALDGISSFDSLAIDAGTVRVGGSVTLATALTNQGTLLVVGSGVVTLGTTEWSGSGSVVSNSELSITWEAGFDHGDAWTYTYEISTDGLTYAPAAGTLVGSTFTATGLLPSTNYWLRMVATDGVATEIYASEMLTTLA